MKWGTDTILQADLLCTKYLYENHDSWKILVNIAGSEYPLKTNHEIVMKYLNARNTVENGAIMERRKMTQKMYVRTKCVERPL